MIHGPIKSRHVSYNLFLFFLRKEKNIFFKKKKEKKISGWPSQGGGRNHPQSLGGGFGHTLGSMRWPSHPLFFFFFFFEKNIFLIFLKKMKLKTNYMTHDDI
jgi:hypothetical protein